MFGVIVTIILILVVLYIILEGIRSATNRAFQHKMEDELNQKYQQIHLCKRRQKEFPNQTKFRFLCRTCAHKNSFCSAPQRFWNFQTHCHKF